MSVVGGLCGTVLTDELAIAAVLTTSGMVEALFYGIHFILFCICLVLLLRRLRRPQAIILGSAIAMYALSTADVALTFRILSLLPRFNDTDAQAMSKALVQAKDTIFVASNFVAEITLLYRCYMVWNRSKYVLVVCSALVTADTVWGFLGMGPTLLAADPHNKFIPVYIWSLFAINIVLTLIAVFRVFWISNVAKRLLGEKKHKGAYRSAIAVLVESSLVYSLCLLIFILWPKTDPKRIYMITICLRIVGMMPTLLIVQVGLGGIINEARTNSTTLSKFQVNHSIVLTTLGASIGRDEDSQSRLGDLRSRGQSTQDIQDEEMGIAGRSLDTTADAFGLEMSGPAGLALEEKQVTEHSPYSG